MSDHPEDECRCGDWRKDHAGGTGPCRYNLQPGNGGEYPQPGCVVQVEGVRP